MSTNIWRKVLIVCDLQKREISNRVLSPIQDIKGRISSQKVPERGPRIPFEAKNGRFRTVALMAPFRLFGPSYRGRPGEGRLSPLPSAGRGPDRAA